jgi:hypothetical protein
MDNFPEDLNSSLLPTNDCMHNIIHIDLSMPPNERYAHVNKRFREIIALRCEYAVIEMEEISMWMEETELCNELSTFLINLFKRFPGRVEYRKGDPYGETFDWCTFEGDDEDLYFGDVQYFRIEIYNDSRKNKIQTLE